MYTRNIEDMDLCQIAESGQCFRINRKYGDTWIVKAFGKNLEVVQEGSQFEFSCEEQEYKTIWASYFDLETDYGYVKRLTDPKDSYLTEAVLYGGGIRVLKQDLWEMIVSFLISQNNNIPRIKKSIELLCNTLDCEGNFPGPDQIASKGLEGLKDLGLGYRDKYILALANSAASGNLDLCRLKESSYEEAHQLLMAQFGIGKKVADCICLFGLHHVDAFPIDTHIKKILQAHYPDGFDYERYQGYLGIIQQYLFYYELKHPSNLI